MYMTANAVFVSRWLARVAHLLELPGARFPSGGRVLVVAASVSLAEGLKIDASTHFLSASAFASFRSWCAS